MPLKIVDLTDCVKIEFDNTDIRKDLFGPF